MVRKGLVKFPTTIDIKSVSLEQAILIVAKRKGMLTFSTCEMARVLSKELEVPYELLLPDVCNAILNLLRLEDINKAKFPNSYIVIPEYRLN